METKFTRTQETSALLWKNFSGSIKNLSSFTTIFIFSSARRLNYYKLLQAISKSILTGLHFSINSVKINEK